MRLQQPLAEESTARLGKERLAKAGGLLVGLK
jgi:hypothetical protein